MEANMKKLSIKLGNALPTKEQLESFEDDNGICLPDDFKSFLLEQNPVTVEEIYFHRCGNVYGVNGFYPFGKGDGLTLQRSYTNLKEFYGGNYIGFADDFGGWEYVLSLKEEDYGKVYFCRMDEEIEKALTLMADNVVDFINGLTKEEELA